MEMIILIILILIFLSILLFYSMKIMKEIKSAYYKSDEVELLIDDMEEILTVINALVIEQNHHLVPKLKALTPDGKLTESQANEVYMTVYTDAVDILKNNESFQKLKEKHGEESILKLLIEEAVSRQKDTDESHSK